MSAPNINIASDIKGKTATLVVTTGATAILSNAAGSGHVYKVEVLIVSNVDGTNTCEVTVDHYRSSTAIRICKSVPVTAKSAYAPITRETSIYLEEGDELRLTAATNGDLEAVCAYEDLS